MRRRGVNFYFRIGITKRSPHMPLPIDAQTHVFGGIVPVVIFDRLFSNLQDFRLGIFYIPSFIFILFLFCFWTKTTKRLILFSLIGFVIYLIGLYDSGPFYDFLYKHVFYFKLFPEFSILSLVSHFAGFYLNVYGIYYVPFCNLNQRHRLRNTVCLVFFS